MHEQVAAAGAAQVRHALAADAQRRAGLGAGPDVEVSSPSSVLRVSRVPSAAAVIGRVTRQCRSSPSRVKTSCGRSWIST